MVVRTFYAGLNFMSRNLLDSAAGGTFMSNTLGASTKLLDDMMVNYSQWHTERAPTGKKVNSVEEISSLNEKVDMIMSMLASKQVYFNFVARNNFNNNAYRNNYGGNNNFRPYPSNNTNAYGNSYGNSNGNFY